MRLTSLVSVSNLLLVFAPVTAAYAGSTESRPAVGFDFASTEFNLVLDGTIGWEFSTSSNILITDLGWMNVGEPGSTVPHEVGIFDENQMLLASVVVQAGTASTLVDGFRYEPIAPLVLAAGRNYVVAGRVGIDFARDVSAFDPLPPGFSLDPEIALVPFPETSMNIW